jgi:D-3-phosphoglycerate dehydrogenase / 2-oxoglutarate reductase
MIVYNAEALGYSEKAKKAWQAGGYEYQVGSWQDIEDATRFLGVEALIVRLQRKVTPAILDKFPHLKMLVSATTGHDHIDETALAHRNVKLMSLRGHDVFLRSIPSTAEHTWALIMSLIRHIPAANTHVQSGKWNRDLFRGIQLKDKTLGIIGYGRTGQKVAKYAKAFSMKVCYYDPVVCEDLQFKQESLEDVFERSDIVSFHVHLTPETTNLLNEENISSVKEHAYLINTSRGKIWQETAVARALKEGKIAGVAVDVLATELTDIKESPLRQTQEEGLNTIITPHIAGATWDAMWATEEFLTEHILNQAP